MTTKTGIKEAKQVAIRRKIGEIIRRKREEKGWTIYDLAEKAGVSPATVSNTERGLEVVASKTIKRILQVTHPCDPELMDILAEAVK